MMRKLLTCVLVILLFAALFGVCVVSASNSISVGQTVTTNVKPFGAETYSFTPNDSGEYAICMEETGANFQQWVCLDDDVELPERYYCVAGWEGKVFSLQAGKTYTIRITHDTGFGGTFARKMRLEKVTATSSLSLRGQNEVYYPGEVSWVSPVLPHPGAISGNFQWSSSNPSVARIEDTSHIYAAVMPVSPGTATITLTVDGLTASYEYVVEDYPVLPIGGSLDVSMPAFGRIMFTVTPTETGRYAIWHTNPFANIILGDSRDGTAFSDPENGCRGGIYPLQAGVTYLGYYIGSPYESGTIQTKICLEKVQPLQHLQLKGSDDFHLVGSTFLISAVTEPFYASAEGVTWTCSDPSVLQLTPHDNICEATILKKGHATVTATVGNLSASWDYPSSDLSEWQENATVTMPVLNLQSTTYCFLPEEDGYYRFTVSADCDTLLVLRELNTDSATAAFAETSICAGEQAELQVYLHKNLLYSIDNLGCVEGSGTLTGKAERLPVSDKQVSRIEVTATPTYEYGNDDYGFPLDNDYHFRPLGYNGMEGLRFTAFYADGTSATVSAEQLSWGEYTDSGVPACTWNSCPVEFSLICDGSTPFNDTILTAPGTVTARLRYMGVSAEFPITVTPSHTHQMNFIEEVTPTMGQNGTASHYQCSICQKLYYDENGMDRIFDPQELVLTDSVHHTVPQDQMSYLIQQLSPGETLDLPVPQSATTLSLPTDAVKALAQQGNPLQLSLSQATVLLDPAALTSISSQANGQTVTVQVQQIQKDVLTAQQQQVLQRHHVACIVSASVLCGEKSIHNFGGGTVTVQIPFEGKPGKPYRIIYIADDGHIEQIPSVCHDGNIEFSTGHFSAYAIVEDDSSQENATQDASTDFVWILAAVAAGILAVGAVVIILKKRSTKKTA